MIGALYAPVATEVTPEGYLYTGFGELMFFVGNPLEPTNQRIKSLLNGYLPIVQYELQHDGVKCSFSAFAAGLKLGLDGLPLNLIRVELKNETRENRHAFLSSAYRFMPPVNRLDREVLDYRFLQRFDLVPKQYAEGQSTFNPDWKYTVADDALARWMGESSTSSRATQNHGAVPLLLETMAFECIATFRVKSRENPIQSTLSDSQTPMGVVTYRVSLEPRQARSLVFKVPLRQSPKIRQKSVKQGKRTTQKKLKATVSSWQALVGRSQPLKFPEQKVQEYLLANTIFDLLAIDRVGDDYVPNVNKFQYHQYYPGNCSDMIVAFDYAGLPEIARKALLYEYKMQAPDGSVPLPYYPTAEFFIEQWGLVLWASTRHYELTRDASSAEVYPGIGRAMAWEERTARGTPSGLMPPSTVGDDAFVKNFRQTGQSIWILIGLRSAIRMAEAAGNQNDAARFEAEYHRYRDAF